jgi:hypothetical protein
MLFELCGRINIPIQPADVLIIIVCSFNIIFLIYNR